MRKITTFVIICGLQAFCLVPAFTETATSWEEYMSHLHAMSKEGITHFNDMEDGELKYNSEGATNYDFPCESIQSTEIPTSVHRLKPSDVKVVAAMGDSLTAANGAKAKTIVGVITEYRGVSWSIGGDESYDSVPTLPNILRQYNPDIIGYSTGTGGRDSAGAHFNVARPSGISEEMPEQARMLVERLQNDASVDFQNDWKVVTLFIGGNDLCRWCNNEEKFAPETYANNIKEALDILHAELPRTFVNLVSVIRVTEISRISKLLCDAFQRIACECGKFGNEGQLEPIIDEYHRLTDELMTSGRYETRDDFTVVVQPAFKHTEIPLNAQGKVDDTYLAPDCFHLSVKGHAAAAESLWNNMIEPVGTKRVRWTPGEPVECPNKEFPYFYTMQNSPPVEPNNNVPKGGINTVAGFGLTHELCLMVAAAAVGCLISFTVLTIAITRSRKSRKMHSEKEKKLLSDFS
ncbi:phospholipase B1, membrane-associated-like [Glandiceps talaboti]